MITLFASIALLIAGYFIYGRFIERIFSPNTSRQTPAYSKQDGVDHLPMSNWKVFMIQFLNIAGTGPIFGAIMGARFGTASYLWIVLGCIFAGAVHDYFSGMLSVRHDGVGLPEVIGIYLGKSLRKVMLVFTLFLLLLVGAVFVYSPALILNSITLDTDGGLMMWVGIIIAYYVIATLLPIDKIIGKIYPLFAFAIIFMAVSLLVCLIVKWPSSTPEIWQGIGNRYPEGGKIFPCLFITIACGAISGFHATQSPMMARCLKNENYGRRIFYGAMITEGVIALIWATVASYFFYGGGAAEMNAEGVYAAPSVVKVVAENWLGVLGSILALLGVVAAPITSGDTALRSARLIVADALKFKQESIRDRLRISIPLFIITALLLWFNISNEDGFEVIWQYFGWANQTLAVFTLWMITVYLYKRQTKSSQYLITMIPAGFMTAVCTAFILTRESRIFDQQYAGLIGAIAFAASIFLFYSYKRRHEL